MRWQKVAQIAISAVVLVFIGAIVVSLRKEKATEVRADPPPAVKGSDLDNPDGGSFKRFDGDRKVLEIAFGKHVSSPDGRMTLSNGVQVTTNRNGKDLVINSRAADVKRKDEALESAVFTGDVRLTSADGIEVKSAEATYTEADGIVRIPGALEFKKGRTSGGGQGGTYDRNRDVLWILDRARISVAPDSSGKGAMDGSSSAAGLARAEHYVKLSKDARINSDGRAMQGDEITITLTPDDQRVQMVQLRGNSRITGGAGGPQSMTARDIDLIYGADGRTLQRANLVEQAVADLGGGAAGKKIAGKTINIGMGPDGTTVIHLAANENVQLDIPPENNAPAKQIRSAALVAGGPPGSGLQNATFTEKVEFRETRGARGNVAAVDRTVRSETLIVETQPGLGAIQKADFRGNVKVVDADLTAEAQRGIYHLEKDRLELMPSEGDPGPPPLINDGRISVAARTIDVTLGSRDLNAETKVKSTILVKKDRNARGQRQTRVPSVLKQDEPVFVTSNRLHYLGSASTATYSGNVKLWQGKETTIKGDKIVLDDRNGNLEATGSVVTELFLDETDSGTGEKKRERTVGKSETFLYNDAGRLATYTTKAQIDGPQGNITANKIELFLKSAGANELERAEAYAGGPELVVVKEGVRTARGTHLTYTAADAQYLMIGTPVTMIEEDGGARGSCRVGIGASLRFFRGVGNWQMEGTGIIPSKTDNNVPCSTIKR